jgi:hypothetical protein
MNTPLTNINKLSILNGQNLGVSGYFLERERERERERDLHECTCAHAYNKNQSHTQDFYYLFLKNCINISLLAETQFLPKGFFMSAAEEARISLTADCAMCDCRKVAKSKRKNP